MKLIKNIAVFLIINFGALAIGTFFMNNGPQSEWYLQLNKAPWTPPGWAFGIAWSTIMFCFSIYMAYLILLLPNMKTKILFMIQFILNIGWNYIFFNQHLILFGLLILLALTYVVALLLITHKHQLQLKSLLILPYFLWLLIACSLNFYILVYN